MTITETTAKELLERVEALEHEVQVLIAVLCAVHGLEVTDAAEANGIH